MIVDRSSKYNLTVELNDISIIVQLCSKCFVYNCFHVCELYPGCGFGSKIKTLKLPNSFAEALKQRTYQHIPLLCAIPCNKMTTNIIPLLNILSMLLVFKLS